MMPRLVTAERAAFAPGRSASGTRRGMLRGGARQVRGARGGGCGGDHRCDQDRQVRHSDEREHQHEDQPDAVAGRHQAAAVEPVGDHPAKRAQRHQGHHPGGRGDTHPHRGMGALVDHSDQGQVVQPVTGLQHGQAAQQPAERRVAQRRPDGPGRRVVQVHHALLFPCGITSSVGLRGGAPHRRADLSGLAARLRSAGGPLHPDGPGRRVLHLHRAPRPRCVITSTVGRRSLSGAWNKASTCWTSPSTSPTLSTAFLRGIPWRCAGRGWYRRLTAGGRAHIRRDHGAVAHEKGQPEGCP